MTGKKAKYTAVYELRGKWYVGYVREVPNAHTQGRTLREVKANLRDALDLVLKVRRQLSKSMKKPDKVIREPIRVRAA
jgi:predicted RNase H-like HicB family nuclease